VTHLGDVETPGKCVTSIFEIFCGPIVQGAFSRPRAHTDACWNNSQEQETAGRSRKYKNKIKMVRKEKNDKK
jgi:hypothetical protein